MHYSMTKVVQSDKLHNVNYEIRGPVLDYANQLEAEGHQVLKLNIGNPGRLALMRPTR